MPDSLFNLETLKQPIISCTNRTLIDPELYHASLNLVSAMPFRNHSKILLRALYFMCFRFELNNKSLFFLCLDCVFVCLRRRPRSDRRRAHQRAVLWAGEWGPVPRPRAQRTGHPRRLWRRQVQFHPLMHVSVLVFINTTRWPVLINCICFACMKTRLDSHPLICDDHSLTT